MSKVLVVGWDGGTWSVADPLCEGGRLPVLESLRDAGAVGTLHSVPNMNSAPAWSTIATGLNPGRHGIFYFDERVPGSYGRRMINAGSRTGPTVWRMASQAGKRVLVVNVPISYPAEPVNGSMVAGLDTPATNLPGFTHPRSLPERYEHLFRSYVVEPQAPMLMRRGRPQQAADALLASVDGWAALTEQLMKDEEWDLAFVVFTSSDTTQHFFWAGDGYRVVERVYEAQDRATGRLVDLARSQDPDVNILILADHGGAANSRGPELFHLWLRDQGLMVKRPPTMKARVMIRGFNLVNRKLTREQKRALSRRFPRLQQRAQAESRLAGIDWSRTRAYSDAVRDDVMVNLRGREPEGVVPVEDHRSFAAELRERILGIRELDTGRPVVESVLFSEDVYWGPFVDRAPDFTIRWVLDGGPFRGFECGTRAVRDAMRELTARPPVQSGGHHPEGMLVASGPNITPGTVSGGLADVTPTILALLGVPMPRDLDGRPLSCLSGLQPSVSIGRVADPSPDREPAGYTAEQEAAVRQRLEDLGYI